MQSTPLVANVTAREEQAWNEQALATPVTQPALRFWHYTEPGLVLGASQSRLLSRMPQDAEHIVARGAGGTAVLTGPWMLSLSLVLPVEHPAARGGPLPAYEWLGRRCQAAMHALGIARAMATADRRDAKSLAWACFAGLSPWEVTVDGRKLVGLAQRRRKQGVLVAAGVLLTPPDWDLACRRMGRPASDAQGLAAAAVSCAELLPQAPAPQRVAETLGKYIGLS